MAMLPYFLAGGFHYLDGLSRHYGFIGLCDIVLGSEPIVVLDEEPSVLTHAMFFTSANSPCSFLPCRVILSEPEYS